MNNRSFVWILLFIVLCSSVFAVPPVTQVGTGAVSGIEIAYPLVQYITQNSNLTLAIHTYNLSNGLPLYQRPSCYVDMYDPTGKHSLRNALIGKSANGIELELDLPASNFSKIGLYNYILWCNMTAKQKGGFVNGAFTVVKDNQIYRLTDNNPSYGIILIGFMFAVAFFLLYFSNNFKLEGEPFGLALTKLAAALILKLLSLGTIIYSIFLVRVITPEVTNIMKIFNSYTTLFVWVAAIFFIIYFIHQFVVLAANFNIWKKNKEENKDKYD